MDAGVDTHRDTLAVAVLNHLGQPVQVCQLPNTRAGFERLTRLLQTHQVDRVGIEGSGNYGRAVAAHLAAWSQLTDGVTAGGSSRLEVVEVPPGLTSRERSGRPAAGKTDPGDAVVIARVTAREERLPQVRLAVGEAADLRALLDYRQQLLDERTRLGNRAHVELASLRPGYQAKVSTLTLASHRQTARRLLRGDHGVRADLTRRRLTRMKQIDAEIAEITALVATRVAASGSSLTGVYGVGVIVAGRILAEVVDTATAPGMPSLRPTEPLRSRPPRVRPCGCESTAEATGS